MSVLVEKKVVRTLFAMALPMLAGTFAMNAYHLTDTWFVSRLGTLALAAMGFTFPVVMLLVCMARGIGSGLTTLVSHAIGRHDHEEASRLVTHGIMLTLAVTAVMSIGGYLLITPIFKSLGAGAAALPLVSAYMRTWFIGAPTMTLPMVGSGILISAGDSKAASWLMIVGTLVNLVLDPIMIFGFLGCPAMGIRGAALATVISQAISMLWLLRLLYKKHRFLAWRRWTAAEYGLSLRRITGFAVPSVLSMLLMPISATVITKLLSGFGYEAVAASGAAGRIEMFAFMIPMALGISLTPFISQNFGAKRLDRIQEAKKWSTGFALAYGGLMTAAFFIFAPHLAAIFTKDPKVAETIIAYIRITCFGYGMMEVHRYCGFFLTGLHRPVAATLLNGVRVLVFLIPLSYLGAHLIGLRGVFWGRLVTDLSVGAIGFAWASHALRKANSSNIKEDGWTPMSFGE
ncbi:MAG TPA: MATE family efflux transporter [bacterium]|nr:MATE family efflux transporter [bacterium]